MGNGITTIDENGVSTGFAYDGLNRNTAINYADGTQESTAYQDAQLKRIATDQDGNNTVYQYDGLYRLTSVTNQELEMTVFGYDAEGNRTSLTDPEANATTWQYDEAGRVTSATDPLNNLSVYQYDKNGNVVEMTDRNDRTIQRVFNFRNQVEQETWVDAAAQVVKTTQYSYDANGNLQSANVVGGESHTFNYDPLNRIDDTSALIPGVNSAIVTDLEYDAAGNRDALEVRVGGVVDTHNTYSYDELNRMVGVQQSGLAKEKTVDISYTPRSDIDLVERYADLSSTKLVVTSNYDYDSMNRLTSLAHGNGSQQFASYQLSFDDQGRLESRSDKDGASTFTYDDSGQLLTATHDFQSDESYTYDDNGNRTNAGYVTSGNNRVQSDGQFTYVYDDEGNRTGKTEIATGNGTSYEYDYENRLTRVVETLSGGKWSTTLAMTTTSSVAERQSTSMKMATGRRTKVVTSFTMG